MNLTKNFTLAELTCTDTGLPNIPDPDEMDNIRVLALFMEKVRTVLGHPILVNSAFRSEQVNEAVGGVPTSAHRLGYACDFTCPGFGPPLDIAERLVQADKSGVIAFDQLINEHTWVHIARGGQLRHEALTLNPDGSYSEGIHE